MSESERDYSVAWLKSEARKLHRTYLPLRRCSICKSAIGYHILKGGVYFDSNCFCTSNYTTPELRSWEDVLKCITMQSTPEIRQEIADTLLGLRNPE